MRERLEQMRVEPKPTDWQLCLGMLAFFRQLLFRSETIATSADPVRSTRRAKLFKLRGLRLLALLWERAVSPFDLNGLASPPEHLIRHLLVGFHDGQQVVYDLQMLAAYPGMLQRLRCELDTVLQRDDARSRWLRDVVVFSGYHERLSAALDLALSGELPDPDDAVHSFHAYLRWCANQPPTPSATWRAWRAGTFRLGQLQLVPPAQPAARRRALQVACTETVQAGVSLEAEP
jgi:hypothetical protein